VALGGGPVCPRLYRGGRGMNPFEWASYIVGSFILFVISGAALLFVLAWLSDKWDSRHSPKREDEHCADLPPPWLRGKK